MTVVLVPLAAGSVAASSPSSFSLPPYFIFIIIAAGLFISFFRASARKRRAEQANPHLAAPAHQHPQAKLPQQTGTAHQGGTAPYVGTLLNGVPLKGYDSSHGHQTTGYLNERMQAEAELKRQLDALDAARRAGQVDADQYAAYREGIFKKF
ncbi:hypothetical protein JOF48_000182 [Arthrobacter stackebrandtii]|uniref:SHOCT domain-containing protein n=1 Tax=Arthrobacter stackebrandtii TaxID=272161 RepID=A0ABS4YRG1_9MICC|nr:hypothetical protein [Arthrobacter stackebrandtii]MBP2411383.1 hypothetical protein [Arthrobacter stackebrandtii]PYH00324.1 hypothetical protein CVV67_11300 [Arthrobacter stackebrandtii]